MAALLISWSCGLSQTSQPSQSLHEDVHQLFIDDQNDRLGSGPVKPYGGDLNSRDALRRDEVRALLKSGKIRTARDFHDSAYIFQHGQEASDYLFAHVLAVEAVSKGDLSAKWISAATLDRYLQSIGQKQIFGTQYNTKTVASVPSSPPATVTTQEPYDRVRLPDSLRLSFCVPNIAQQEVNLKEFMNGHYPSHMVPPGCTR
jgi:hypothetical protein